MSKVITSPVKRFPGTVTLSDPLTFPQALAVEDALDASKELGEATQNRHNYTVLPGLLACVEQWHIKGKGFPKKPMPDTFPSTPAIPVAELIAWLIEEIVLLYHETEPDPNE